MPTRTSEQKSLKSRGADSPAKAKRALAPAAAGNKPATATAESAAVKSPTVKADEPRPATLAAKTGKAAKAGQAGKSHLSAKDLEHFNSLLLAERARLEEEREQVRSRSSSVDGALPEEGEGGDEDTADLAAAMMDKEMDLSVEDEIEDLLAAVDHALQKIEDGTYGICDVSGEPIPTSRLELIPWAALTVECQALAEGQ